MVMRLANLIISVFCLVLLGGLTSSQPCPNRNPEEGRDCSKACLEHSECRGAKRRCICDDDCGMSCLNPNKTCGEPERLENGEIIGDGRYLRDTILYRCNSGYMLSGTQRRLCRSDRQWSETAPTCTVGCRSPRSMARAFPDAIKSEYAVGEEVSYLCRFGYILSGKAKATCMEGGTWSLTEFFCVPVNCGDPGNPRNGYQSSGDEYTFGSRVVFACNKGYELQGSQKFVSCDTTGIWRPQPIPTCAVLECGVPRAPTFGLVSTSDIDSYVYGSRVRYSCDPGYKLEGNDFGRCNENETWGEIPSCVVNDGCDFEGRLEESCNYDDIGWNRVIVSDGPMNRRSYVLRTTFSTASSTTATFTSSLLRTTRLCLSFYYRISDLGGVNNFIVNSIVDGRRNRVWATNDADDDDVWLSAEVNLPVSEVDRRIEFRVQQTLRSSRVEIDDVTLVDGACANQCQYEPCQNEIACINRIDDYECVCSRNYEGKNCTEEITCNVRNPPQDGYIPNQQLKIPVGSSVTYMCYEGYRVSGEATAQCVGDDIWSHDVPVCQMLTCDLPSATSNVVVQPLKQSWFPGEVITYSCKDNHELIGDSTATCLADGQWSNTNARCRALPDVSDCPRDYFLDGPYCFKVSHTTASYNNAKAACAKEGSILSIFLHGDVQQKVIRLINEEYSLHQGYFWIGLNNKPQKGRFIWENGFSFHYFATLINQKGYYEDCIALSLNVATYVGYTNGWTFFSCNTEHRYICMKWSSKIRPFRFNSPDPNFNGVYSPEYGFIGNDLPYYFLQRSRGIYNAPVVYKSSSNAWRSAGFRDITSTYFVNSNAFSPLEISETWKHNGYFSNTDVTITIQKYDMWGEWSNDGSCSVTCGGGQQVQRRRCHASLPSEYLLCQGRRRSIVRCDTQACPIEKNPCLPNPCRNGGTCQKSGQITTCRCRDGWSGSQCNQKNPCEPNPCRHNGVCEQEGLDAFSCACTSRWSGETCMTARNICVFDPARVQAEVLIEGVSGTEHEIGEAFNVRCRDGQRILNTFLATLTCSDGGKWIPDYTFYQCS